ncbi:mitochondrial import receptor subunit Tom22-domain-containing protein [Mycena haematopus]|nr:mitochondrial import receptor subunit Tom22-domain-containing protein [Mycena haematopus]
MVKVEIVESNSPYASDASSRNSSSSSLSSVSSELEPDESVFDRLAALVDIVPPTTRHSIYERVSKTASWLKWGGKRAGSFVWIVTTSALLVALPLALVLEDEAKIVAQEREFLEQQQGQQQMLAPSMYPPNPNQPKALVPPGF